MEEQNKQSEHNLLELLLNEIEKESSRLAHSAAYDNCLHVDRACYVGDCSCKCVTHNVHNGECKRIARLCKVNHILRGDIGHIAKRCRNVRILHSLLRLADNSRGARHKLKTVILAAVADLRISRCHRHVSNLTSAASRTCNNLSVKDNTAAYACAKCDHKHI